MLGLQSDIQAEAQISNLSITSNHQIVHKNSNPSTNYGSSCVKEDSSPYLQLESQNKPSYCGSSSSKVRQLKNRLKEQQRMQQMLDQKIEGYVINLQQELVKKQKQNNLIQQTVLCLRRQVEQSRNDIMVLINLLNKRKKNNQRNRKQGNLGNSSNANNCMNNGPEIEEINQQQQIKGRIYKKVTSNSPRTLLKKPTSPKIKNILQKNQQFCTKASQDDKRKSIGRKSTRILGSSPFRRPKLAKSP